MPVEIVGMVSHRMSTERLPVPPRTFDRHVMREVALAHERADFDRVLVAQSSFWPDSMPIATHLAAVTERLGFMIAHRPGFVAPTMAARMFAALDQLSDGRAAIHVITAANDLETQCDGDFLTKEQRYRRAREFVQVLREVWGAAAPISHEGEFFRFNNALSETKPYRAAALPVFWAGSSDQAIQFAGECADTHAFSLRSLADARALTARVRASAAAAGRTIAGQGTIRIILGDTEGKAWDRANFLLQRSIENSADRQRITGTADRGNAGGRKEAALSGKINSSGETDFAAMTTSDSMLDSGVWVGPQQQGLSFPPAMVGTPAQVVANLMPFYRLGVTGFLIHGPELLDDAIDFGREFIPRLRIAAAEADAADAAVG